MVREAGDLANALFDQRGRMVAQAVTGTPGHINSLAVAVRNILDEYPAESLVPGDVLITNDPYKTAGQLLDVTVLVPVFRDDRLIAFFGSTIHHTDVGGYGIGAGARDVFEEGIWIPIVKLFAKGERNDDVWRFILSNVRQPDHMAGDLHAQRASAEVGAQRLASLMDAHGLDDIEDLADEIISRSEEATRRSIRALPAGTVRATSVVDLADGSEITVAVAITVDPVAGEILVDYEGSSGASPFGINVVKNYTHAYTTFTVRSVLNPEVPNNAGSLAPIKVEAPVGSIVNAVTPAPCTARHVVGMFLPMPIMQALAQIVPEAVMAEGAAAVWTCQVIGPARRRPAVHHGDVHLRRRRRCPALQARAVGDVVPDGRGGRAGGGRRGVRPDPLPAEVAAPRLRRRRPPARGRRADRRVHRRHRGAVGPERRGVAPGARTGRAVRRRDRARPDRSRSTASRCAPRRG